MEGHLPPTRPADTTGLNSGDHTLVAKNSDGCTSQVTVTIGSAPGAPAVPQTQIVHPTCEVATGSFTITSPTTGLTFSLDGGAFDSYPSSGYTNLQPGPHTLQVKNSDGCTNSVTVTINPAPPTPAQPTVSVTDPTCDVATGSFVITSPTNGLTFSLDGGDFAAYPAGGYTGLNTGDHILIAKNSDGCTSQVTLTIGSAPGAPPDPHLHGYRTNLHGVHRFVCGNLVHCRTNLLAGWRRVCSLSRRRIYRIEHRRPYIGCQNSDGCTSQVTVTIGSAPGAPAAPTTQAIHPDL
jgi:large repetitive protein